MVTTRVLALALLAAAPVSAAIPTPAEHLGFTPGDDYKLADYGQIVSYFQKLEKGSDRIRLREFGKTSLGKPIVAPLILSGGNLKHLDEYREINRKLALGLVEADEARRLAARGQASVWIDSGLHARAVAAS